MRRKLQTAALRGSDSPVSLRKNVWPSGHFGSERHALATVRGLDIQCQVCRVREVGRIEQEEEPKRQRSQLGQVGEKFRPLHTHQ